VVPPKGAIASKVAEAVLAKGADDSYRPVGKTTKFAAADEVYLVGRGDFGFATWLQADWFVNGTYDEAGTRSITLQEDIKDTGFSFSFIPDGGWPAGEHTVALTMNDVVAGRYTFTVGK
jgi:hypothetical protein